MVRKACGWSDEADDDDPESSSIGGVIGRGAWDGDGSCVGVRERERDPDPRLAMRLRSGDACVGRLDEESEKLVVLVLVVLPDPRRFRNENDNDLCACMGEGVFDDAGHGACGCVTNDESRLYAGVDGSDGLSVNTGNDMETWKPDIVAGGGGCD